MNRLALLTLALLLPGCSLFLPVSASCSQRIPIFTRCPPADSTADRQPLRLSNRYWKLVQLGETAVRDGLLLREAHLLLDGNRQRFSGSGGCNQITGRYTVSGADEIRFSEVAGTKMACPGLQLEQDLLMALEKIRRWRIEGDTLKLLDASDNAIAAFLYTPGKQD